MKSASDYEREMWQIVESIAPKRKLELHLETPLEVKLHKSTIIQAQKELRLLKREIGTLIKDINASFATEKAKVGTGFGAGFAAGLFGKKMAGKSNAIAKQNLRNKQLNAVAPYKNVLQQIDQVLEQFDRIKLQIDQWLVEQQKV